MGESRNAYSYSVDSGVAHVIMGESRNAYSYSVDSGATYCMIKRDFLAGV
jgi:hypothetical protein